MLSEVLEKQCCESNGEALRVDVSEDTLQDYGNFTQKGFEKCAMLIADKSAVPGQLSVDEFTEVIETENYKGQKMYR